MSKELTAMDKYILCGDLKRLSPQESMEVYREMCNAYDLDYRFKPFEIIDFQGMTRLYFSKAGCDLLASSRQLTREIEEIKIDEENLVAECRCTIIDKSNDRKDSDIAFRSIGELVPQGQGKPPIMKMISGKKLALEKLKLISQAKRRATLSFVGCTIPAAEDIYLEENTNIQAPIIESTPKELEKEEKSILPTPKDLIKEIEKPVEELKKEEIKEVEKPVEEPKKEEKNYLQEVKMFIKDSIGTLKKFREEFEMTPEALAKRWEAEAPNEMLSTFIAKINEEKNAQVKEETAPETTVEEFDLDFTEEIKEETEELFSHENTNHKKLVMDYFEKNVQGWRNDSELLKKIVKTVVSFTNKVKLSELEKAIKENILNT